MHIVYIIHLLLLSLSSVSLPPGPGCNLNCGSGVPSGIRILAGCQGRYAWLPPDDQSVMDEWKFFFFFSYPDPPPTDIVFFIVYILLTMTLRCLDTLQRGQRTERTVWLLMPGSHKHIQRYIPIDSTTVANPLLREQRDLFK